MHNYGIPTFNSLSLIPPGLFPLSSVMLWARPPHSVPYRPRFKRSLAAVLLSLLLICSGVEPNPGPTGPSTMSVGCLNVRSAVNKSAIIHDVIADNNLDILSLSETWITNNLPPAISNDCAPQGYSVLHVPRTLRAGGPAKGGGLAVVFKKTLFVRTYDVPGLQIPTSFELQIVRVGNGASSYVMINIYRPPSGSKVTFFDEIADVFCSVAASTNDKIFICGDANCPGVDSLHIDADLELVLSEFGMKQLVLSPTRDENILDIFAVETNCTVSNVKVLDAGYISDHRLVLVCLPIHSGHKPPSTTTYRQINKINPEAFEQSLLDSEIFSRPESSVDLFADQFKRVVIAELDKVAPLRSSSRRKLNPITRWLSTSAVAAKRNRRRLEKRWRTSHAESDRIAYRQSCRKANKLIMESRQNFYRNTLENCSNSSERWRVVKDLLHSRAVTVMPDLASIDNDLLCNKFNNFFVDKIVKLKQTISDKIAQLASFQVFADVIFNGVHFNSFKSVSAHDVSMLLNSLNCKTSQADFIPTTLLKSCPSVFSQIIAKLANLSFSQGSFPKGFKLAQLTPLLKKPGLDNNDLSNYRPISNLNNISKILERLCYNQILSHILSNPNFNSCQSAYRTSHSTETALTCMLDNIFHSSDEGFSTLLVSLDLSAAFDTIDHSILLSRLSTTFGVTGPVLDWFRSYLSGRQQFVRLGPSSSCTISCSSGVPQGSVLGPLLFNIYTSPVASIVHSFGIQQHQYADDTQLYVRVSTITASASLLKLESCLTSLNAWYCQNGLALNPSKSNALLLGTRKRNQSLSFLNSVNIAGSKICPSDSTKLLGVTLDSNLTLDSHVSAVCKASFFHIRALRHIRPSITQDTAKSIASALIGSRLDYANSVLSGTSAKNLARLQRIQNTLSRVVMDTPHHRFRSSHHANTSTSPLQQLHWLPIKSRVNFKIAVLAFKCRSNSAPPYLANLLTDYSPSRSLRSSDTHLLDVPRVKTAFGARAFRSAAPTAWNSLPLALRASTSFPTFKQNLKTCLFQQAFDV